MKKLINWWNRPITWGECAKSGIAGMAILWLLFAAIAKWDAICEFFERIRDFFCGWKNVKLLNEMEDEVF